MLIDCKGVPNNIGLGCEANEFSLFKTFKILNLSVHNLDFSISLWHFHSQH